MSFNSLETQENDPFRDENTGNNQIREKVLPSRCLECHGEVLPCAPNSVPEDLPAGGLFRSDEFNLLFCHATRHADFLDKLDSIELFKNSFDPDLALLEKHKILFQMARKYFFMLEVNALQVNTNTGHRKETQIIDYQKIRQQLCLFFSFVRSYLFSIPSNNEFRSFGLEVTPHLSIHLKQWRLLLHGFCKLPHNVVRNCVLRPGNTPQPASNHLFHCHLEMRWYHLTTLLALTRCNKYLETSSTTDALKNDMKLFIAELIYISEGVFASSTLQGIDRITKLCPFPCTCVREIWLMLQILLDKLHSNTDIDKPFWGLIGEELEPYLKGQKLQEPPSDDCSQLKWPILGNSVKTDQASLCLWLFLHLSRLYGYSENGLYMDSLRQSAAVTDATELLEDILKSLLSNNENIKESKLREVMQVLLVLPTFWPTGISPILVLWEVFLQRINSFFVLESETPSVMAVIGKRASDFALQVKLYLRPTDQRYESENSYNLFLRLLGSQLEAMAIEPEVLARAWRQLKGRVYPKFPPTRLQTMSELGLYHLSSLMLTLALAIDINEVGERLQQMLSSVPKSRESGKRSVVWRTHLTLLLLRAEKSMDLRVYAEPLLELLTDTSNKITLFSTPEIELMRMYVEALQDIADAVQKPNLGIHVLIGKWLPSYLEICSTTDVCRTLDAIQAVANKLGIYNAEQLGGNSGERELYEALKKHVLPYLMQQSSTPNVPTQKIADLAVTMALGASDSEFSQLLAHFISSDIVNVRVTARFLTQLLPNEAAMERIKSKILNYNNTIIQVWVKCCLLGSDNRTEMSQLTRAVSRLPQLITLCGGSTDLLLDSSEPLEALAQILESRLQAMQSLRDKQVLKEMTLACLGRIDSVAEATLKNKRISTATIARLYQTTGYLVQCCAPLLYSKGTVKCLLKGIISQMLLPMSIFKADSDFQPDKSLKHALPLFLNGIAKLGPKHDIYIARTIREIVMHYTSRLAPAEHGADHPLMECLKEKSELSLAILDSIKISFFSKRPRNLPHGGVQALQMLQSLIMLRDYDVWLVREIATALLEPLLNQMMCLEEGSMDKKEVVNTIKEIVCSPAFVDTPDIQLLFDGFMKKFYTSLGFHMGPVFRILMWLASLRPALLIPSLPDLRAEIAQVEKLRGVGRDAALRGHLAKLEAELGA